MRGLVKSKPFTKKLKRSSAPKTGISFSISKRR
jgi:hypothetical protein